MTRTVLRGGYLISPRTRGLPDRGDVVIDDGVIVDVTTDSASVDAEIVDVTGQIVMPGFVDTHRHTWQTQLRGVCADYTLLDYFRAIRSSYAVFYRPEDVLLGNLLGALDALNSGVTSILDFSHCMISPDHADAAVDGLDQAGVRAVFGYGFYEVPADNTAFQHHDQRLSDAKRICSRLDGHRLLTMGLSGSEVNRVPFETTKSEVALARELSVLLTFHSGCYWGMPLTHCVDQLASQDLIDEHQVHVHANAYNDKQLKILADNGAAVSCTPETEMNMGMGHPILQRALDAGLDPTLGCDVVSLNSGDLFAQMRLGLASARALHYDVERVHQQGTTVGLSVDDVLAFATTAGANALGLGSDVGRIAPGMQADLVVLDPRSPMAGPVNDPRSGWVVFQADRSSVNHVMVAGRFVKRDGLMSGVDYTALARRLEASNDYITTKAQALTQTALAGSEEYRDEMSARAEALHGHAQTSSA